ncbi:uncharacterized protein BDW47DRAFT_106656 [Aspergillus candidus]|uniref:Uncharacterized protein n=1 Tax=Aspergillus candidus TaxID=41067 RepID=A0A2I2FAP8_ASPCN|nr:hypothetical protein BDW47DRAFT_106656 [Aspergillus candidus]PLB37705.1 hypothetical protein BDW47DRAFT_106656 [Aspergillus candidus]
MDSHQVPCIPIQSHSSPSAPAALRCCCGRDDCAFLHHNQVALEGLEKDLDTAAKLGQALLHRHESYMAEAEEDRHRLLFSVESLEREKLQAQAENARIIAENRNLLEQLEDLNKAVTESDARAKSLAVTLESTEAQLRKLTVSAARAAELEAQLAQMETEQSKLQESLQSAHEDNKSAVQRWRKAECTLRDLHDQVDRIEKEAREERDRHSDLIQRMERRRTVERELDGAAGRLKGAAAAQELGRSHGDNNVVSRFVRDILQDNASLQMGIVELREMLESSNQEVQNLRDQVLYHQPMASDAGGEPDQATTLSQELESREDRRVSREFHIHHHYHTPSVKKEKGTLLRRSKKRRSWGNPAHLHSAPSALLLPRKAGHRSQSSTSSTSTILSQTSVSIPPSASHRWSLQTPATDSLASSPQSGYRSSSSLFDRVERCFDSQPTSPESSVFMTSYKTGRPKNGREGQDEIDDLEPTPCYGIHPYDHPDQPDKPPMQSVIPEETEDNSIQYHASERAESPGPAPDVFSAPYRPLRRGSSHESLFSVAGMDIHTPSHQPSRMSDLTGTLPIRIPHRIVSSTAELSATPPVISTNTVTADRGPLRAGQSPQTLLASVAAAKHHDASSVDSDHSNATVTPTRKMPLTRRVGGWVRGRWGTAPVTSDHVDCPNEAPISSSSSSSRTSSVPPPVPPPAEQPRPSSSGDKNRGAPSLLHFRYPGVNQKGPIMGFRPAPRAPAVLHPENLDEGLLRESLAE